MRGVESDDPDGETRELQSRELKDKLEGMTLALHIEKHVDLFMQQCYSLLLPE